MAVLQKGKKEPRNEGPFVKNLDRHASITPKLHMLEDHVVPFLHGIWFSWGAGSGVDPCKI